jgi:nucleoside 2-deoxyribosyltransferase
MTSDECVIWKTRANWLEGSGDFQVLDSPRAGGKYWISGSATARMVAISDTGKLLLTTWLCEQRRAGVGVPRITDEILGRLDTLRPMSVPRRVTAALLFIGQCLPQLGMRLSIGDEDNHTMGLLAETGSRDIGELSELGRMLESQGLFDGQFYMGGGFSGSPTYSGWNEIERLTRQPQTNSTQAFVAMWFSAETDEAYAKGIHPAIESVGYKPFRIDQKEHNNKIDDEIIAEIRRSRFLVADFTSEPEKPRGGVYYEAGFAHGLGIPVIWTARKGMMDYLHFDTRQYSHIVWENPADLFEKLKNRIAATIGEGPVKR